jgi:signal peptidase I
MFRLDLYNVLSQRVIAMERTFMKELGLKYGDVVYIEGTGKYDGVWQIQDTMNKRFAGQHKIDILVPENVKYGQWENVKIYTLKDKTMTDTYRSKMAPQVSKQELVKQVNNKKKEFKRKKAQKLAIKK